MWVPKKKEEEKRPTETGAFENFILFLFFSSRFSLRFTEIGSSEFVGTRSKVLYSTRATLGNQKHGISPSFQLKFGKSYVLVEAEGQIDPRIASYAWVLKYWNFVKLYNVWIFV